MQLSKKYKILVVDDDLASTELLKIILDDNNLEIITANDGIVALQEVEKHEIDLILLDIIMPGMTGFEAIGHLKNEPKTKDIPVIFVSSMTDKENLVKGFELGASDYVIKPYNTAELTARVQTQLEFRQSQQELILAKEAAELSSKIKSDFLANLSHEIRTPIAGIMGVTELLSLSNKPFDQQKLLGIIKSSTDLLLSIINDILDSSKIESGKMELETIEFEIQKCLEDVLALFTKKALDKEIDLNLQIDPKIPPILKGDPIRLKQVFMNLISNAVKFTDKGSISVILRLKKSMGNLMEVSAEVTDTGIGIRKEDQEKLFTAFTQIDASTTRKYGGTGLGLSISKSLIHLMGGNITLQSEPGMGSTFTFTAIFEVDRTTIQDLDDTYEPPSQFPLDILIAEDNIAIQTITHRLISSMNHSCTIAKNGIEAVELNKTGNYDLILMDINMPDMDGFNASKAIRKFETLNKRQRTYIVATTANAYSNEQKKCMEAGMDCFIRKPYKQDELQAIIEKTRLLKTENNEN